MDNEKYLRLLAKEYPNQKLATGEIIRLQSYCELPKGTEYFSVTYMVKTEPSSI